MATATATSISLSKFTASVQSAVKAAVAKHPKFKISPPNALTVSYLIRGFPIPDTIAAAATLGEVQAFADEVAASLATANPEALAAAAGGGGSQGAFISVGHHVVCGIPPASMNVQVQQ